MVATENYFVIIRQRERVLPTHQIVEHRLPLSNLDLLLPHEYVSVFFCYKKPDYSDHIWSFGQIVSTMKTALAQVLVHFYVFSSEMVHNSRGEPEIMCNNQGVEFIEAYTDVGLCDLNLYNPDESVQCKLVPSELQRRVFSVQATEFICGGTVIGCTFDHRVADAYSCNMFLLSWAEMAKSKPISMVPSFTRHVLNARYPSCYDASLNDMYIPMSSLTPSKNETILSKNEPLLSRIYHVDAKEIDNLQSQTGRTKLESFSAFMWMLISKHASTSPKGDMKIPSSKTCKMGIVVDGRTRLANKGEGRMKQRLINCYFGNVLSIPFGEKVISDIIAKPLNLVAQEVHQFLEKPNSKDHFQDLINFVETHRPELCLAKIYSSGRNNGPAFVVSSGQQFPVSEIDFGWGRPMFGSYHFPWGGNAGYVVLMPCSTGDGLDWIVYMHLKLGQLEFVEKEASHVFKHFKLS